MACLIQMEESERKSEELLLSIRTIYSFRYVCNVKEGHPGENGSNGSSTIHASPLLGIVVISLAWFWSWCIREVGWLVCFQCRVNEIVSRLCCSPSGKYICAWIKCFRMSVQVKRGCLNDIPSELEQCWRAPQGQERTDLVLISSEQPPWGKLSPSVPWEKE